MSWLVDPVSVAAEYESERSLRKRVLAHRELVDGPDDEDVVRTMLVAARPRRLLEVGSGLGDLCAWAREQLKVDVVAVDASPRMVELATTAGATGVLADMRQLPFPDESFGCAVANFVPYHIEDPATSISELARVLEPDGTLIASTLSDDTKARHQAWAELFDEQPQPDPPPLSFSRENGRELLLRQFGQVEQIDCDAQLVFPNRERLVRYIDAAPQMKGLSPRVPPLKKPFRLPEKTSVFHASAPK